MISAISTGHRRLSRCRDRTRHPGVGLLAARRRQASTASVAAARRMAPDTARCSSTVASASSSIRSTRPPAWSSATAAECHRPSKGWSPCTKPRAMMTCGPIARTGCAGSHGSRSGCRTTANRASRSFGATRPWRAGPSRSPDQPAWRLVTTTTLGLSPSRRPTDRAKAQLMAVTGIGEWTSDVFLMFNLRRPDATRTSVAGLRGCGLRRPEFEHRNGANSSSLACVPGKAWVAPRLLGVDAVAFSTGQFADGHLVCLGSAFDTAVTGGGQVVVPVRVGGCSCPGCEDVDDVRLGVVREVHHRGDVLPPALAAAVMHQDQRSALEDPANPALVRSELRDGLRVPVERLAHVELLSFTIPGYALARVMGAATAVLRDQYSSADPNT